MYTKMKRNLCDALHDLRILAGDVVGPSGASWQDVAGTAAVNLRALADQIEQARELGQAAFDCAVVFPSPDDCEGES